MMNEINEFIRLGSDLIHHYLPEERLALLMPTTVGFLALGVVLSLFGAKLARVGVTLALAAGGWAAGSALASYVSLSSLWCGLIGALLAGLVAQFALRMWVAVGCSLLLASAVGGGFSLRELAPMWQTFDTQRTVSLQQAERFVLPDPKSPVEDRQKQVAQYLQDFWKYATGNDVHLERNMALVSGAAALLGLVFGLVLWRFALMLATSFLGASMTVAAVTGLVGAYRPEWQQAMLGRPNVMLAAMGIFFVLAVMFQYSSNRKRKAPPAEAAAEG